MEEEEDNIRILLMLFFFDKFLLVGVLKYSW